MAEQGQAAGRLLYKDEVLDRLADVGNVAQFVSFGPSQDLPQRHARVVGRAPDQPFSSAAEAVETLLTQSPEGLVNIRSFRPESPEGNPFYRKLDSIDAVLAKLRELAAQGLHTIVNETVNESDGGVSGVAHGGLLEFAPDTTPRCVDDPSIVTCRLPLDLGRSVLQTVYGMPFNLDTPTDVRIEFSLHPIRRGWRHTNFIVWQYEQLSARDLGHVGQWPNAFSRLLGDKAFGLLIAHGSGVPVPRTTVYTRRLFPFTFGTPTGSGGLYMRTCPEEKAPGFYPSRKGWCDPYAVLADSRYLDEEGFEPLQPLPASFPKDVRPLASVLCQESIRPKYSGRLIVNADQAVLVDGVRGGGEAFMLGQGRGELPDSIIDEVKKTYDSLAPLGPVEFEWVHDGHQVWIVQLHLAKVDRRIMSNLGGVEWEEFHYSGPAVIEQFRNMARRLQGTGKGVRVHGNVSPLSHVGEIAMHYGVPAVFDP